MAWQCFFWGGHEQLYASEVKELKRTTVTPEWMGEVRKRMKVNNMASRDLAAARTLPPSTAAAH